MKIIHDRPPNFEQIAKAFRQAYRPGVMFAYDDAVYLPSGGEIPPQLICHEQVHLDRQKEIGVDKWWELYISNIHFRFEEELLAHIAEYKYFVDNASRQVRRHALKEIAKRLASPLYNNMISRNGAERAILEGVDNTLEAV